MGLQELIGTLAAKWSRQLVAYADSIYCLYADEALTGFVNIVESPLIGDFKNEKCLLVPLATWVMLTTLSNLTITPFRIAAQGKSIIVGAWRPHQGLKYAIRNTSYGAMLHIPLSEFKDIDA